MRHRDDYSVTPHPIRALVVIGLTLSILFYLAAVGGAFSL